MTRLHKIIWAGLLPGLGFSGINDAKSNPDFQAELSDGFQTTRLQFDALGNLRSVTLPDRTNIEYLLDAANRRVGKKTNGKLVQGFLYQDSLKPVAELDGQNKIISHFIYGIQDNVPEVMVRDGKVFRIIADERGSPRLVVDVASGQIVQRMNYDEFGQVIQDTNPGFQPFGFTGGLYDIHTKFVRLGAREYDSHTGRWLSGDPLRFAGSQLNLYGYVGNDPINRRDPTGLRDVAVKKNPDGSTEITFVCPVKLPQRPWPPQDFDYSTVTASEGDTAIAIRDGTGGGGGETVRPAITIKMTHPHDHDEIITVKPAPKIVIEPVR